VPIDPQYLSALADLYRTKQVALLDDLREALHTQSRTTIFRVLSAADYLTSYSHAGRYYTLKRIPKFDSHGSSSHPGSRAEPKTIPGRLPLPQLQTKAGFRAMGPAATTGCGSCP